MFVVCMLIDGIIYIYVWCNPFARQLSGTTDVALTCSLGMFIPICNDDNDILFIYIMMMITEGINVITNWMLVVEQREFYI